VDPGIALDVVAAVRAALADKGVEVERVMPASFEGPVVPGTMADALFDLGASALGDPAIAVTVASAIPIGGIGVLDYTLCTSATVRDALRKVAEHYGVATQRAKLELVEDGSGQAKLVFHRMPGIAHSRHWVEFPLIAITARIRTTSGNPMTFRDVGFQHPAPTDQSAHDRYFGVPVTFAAPGDAMTFDANVLDLPLKTASTTMAALLEARIKELAPALATVDPLLDRVRRALSQMLDEKRTDVDELAKRLSTSKRSLQRSLGDLGTSHSEMLDRLRKERAFQLLDRGLKVADVATELAFTAPSAFFRAYRRWTGTSPKAPRPTDDEPELQ
jgi:AraC-like DNA-binding protein